MLGCGKSPATPTVFPPGCLRSLRNTFEIGSSVGWLTYVDQVDLISEIEKKQLSFDPPDPSTFAGCLPLGCEISKFRVVDSSPIVPRNLFSCQQKTRGLGESLLRSQKDIKKKKKTKRPGSPCKPTAKMLLKRKETAKKPVVCKNQQLLTSSSLDLLKKPRKKKKLYPTNNNSSETKTTSSQQLLTRDKTYFHNCY